MTTIDSLFSTPLTAKAGWCLVHFLWQGLVAAAGLLAAQAILRYRSAQLRYLVGCVILLVMMLCPVATFLLIRTPDLSAQPSSAAVSRSRVSADQPGVESPAGSISGQPNAAGSADQSKFMAQHSPAVSKSAGLASDPAHGRHSDGTLPPSHDSQSAEAKTGAIAGVSQRPAGLVEQSSTLLGQVLPYVILIWIVGVMVCCVWHIGGWVQVQRLRRGGEPLGPSASERLWESAARRLGKLFHLGAPVRLLRVARLAGPIVIGVLKPAVLVPAALLTALTPAQAEAILAHELAHVRRHDYLVNLFQAFVETLLFYHPAVWWVSGRIRAERENCCDDLAIAAVGDRRGYGAALAELAEFSLEQQTGRGMARRLIPLTHLSQGAKMNLLARIGRVLGCPPRQAGRGSIALVGILGLSALLCVATMLCGYPRAIGGAVLVPGPADLPGIDRQTGMVAPTAVMLVIDTPAAMPAPGKTDTFEQDTWMRRNKYPLKIVLIETEGKDAKDVPVTLSVACGEGDYAAGQLTPLLAGKPLPAQVDVLATWPSDKSIKHALVSIVLPNIAAKQRLEITFKKEAPAAPAKFKAPVDLKDFTARTEFATSQGETTISQVPAETMAQISRALAGELSVDQAKKIAPRMCGPLCYEFEILVPAQTGGKPDADIDVYYYLRFYSGQKGVRVAYVVENTRLPKKPYKDVVVSDRAFSRLAFQAGPVESVKTLYEQGTTTHWFGTRYQMLRWWGEKPASIYTKENLGYLVYSQFFPKLDLDNPLTPKQTEELASHVVKQPWYKDPAEFPDGVPLSNGPLCAYGGTTGGRAEIGELPTWYRYSLASESPILEQFSRIADGNSEAAFAHHMRPAENRQPGDLHNDPIRDMFYRGQVKHNLVDGKRCPNGADSGHLPNAAYYTYLATGEKFYEDELAFYSTFSLHNNQTFLANHSRYEAWPLRNTTDAAFVLPDGHPMKQYLIDFVQRTLEYQVTAVKDPEKYWGYGWDGRATWPCIGQNSFWMHVFYVGTLDNAARKGFYPVAAVARDAAADLLIRMYLADEEFKAPDGKVYRANPRYAISYLMAVSLVRVDRTDPKHIKGIPIKTIVDNTGAIFYYTMVGSQYETTDWNNAAYQAKLPQKQIIEPEDLKLDPEYAKTRWGVGVENNDKAPFWPAGHEEHNGFTSAALARYDNPRAQKMYELVRGYITNWHNAHPTYFKGIDYVK